MGLDGTAAAREFEAKSERTVFRLVFLLVPFGATLSNARAAAFNYM